MVKVGIIGARGYSGQELAKLLMRHPNVHISGLFAQNLKSPEPLSKYSVNPKAKGLAIEALSAENPLSSFKSKPDWVFLATPAEASIELAPKFLQAGVKVIDLSGAFRLDPRSYPETYQFTHPSPELVKSAYYGLVPFAGPVSSASGKTDLISNPGCYATAALMGLIPVLKAGLIKAESIVIDAKSGTSGAGKKAAENLLYTEVAEDCIPYRVGNHQHAPEIAKYLGKFGGAPEVQDLCFTTHLLPIRRGILCSIYADLSSATTDLATVSAAFDKAFSGYALVKHGPLNDLSQLAGFGIKAVAGTAYTQIGYQIKNKKLFIFSFIDNLLKGAASQAIENFNRANDFNPERGLDHLEALT